MIDLNKKKETFVKKNSRNNSKLYLVNNLNDLLSSKLFSEKQLKYCFFSFSSDWLFPTSETKTILKALKSINAKSSFMEINTDKGHDAFLLDEPEFHLGLKKFITGQIKEIKL